MTIVRIGATQKYADGWAVAFGKGRKTTSGAATMKPSKSRAKKKAKRKASKAKR